MGTFTEDVSWMEMERQYKRIIQLEDKVKRVREFADQIEAEAKQDGDCLASDVKKRVATVLRIILEV